MKTLITIVQFFHFDFFGTVLLVRKSFLNWFLLFQDIEELLSNQKGPFRITAALWAFTKATPENIEEIARSQSLNKQGTNVRWSCLVHHTIKHIWGLCHKTRMASIRNPLTPRCVFWDSRTGTIACYRPRLTIMANSWIFIHDHGFFNTLHTYSWKFHENPWSVTLPWIIDVLKHRWSMAEWRFMDFHPWLSSMIHPWFIHDLQCWKIRSNVRIS